MKRKQHLERPPGHQGGAPGEQLLVTNVATTALQINAVPAVVQSPAQLLTWPIPQLLRVQGPVAL